VCVAGAAPVGTASGVAGCCGVCDCSAGFASAGWSPDRVKRARGPAPAGLLAEEFPTTGGWPLLAVEDVSPGVADSAVMDPFRFSKYALEPLRKHVWQRLGAICQSNRRLQSAVAIGKPTARPPCRLFSKSRFCRPQNSIMQRLPRAGCRWCGSTGRRLGQRTHSGKSFAACRLAQPSFWSAVYIRWPGGKSSAPCTPR
jgi:hypothetical protein